VRFFLKWLRGDRPAGVALHPSRTIDVESPAAAAFDRCIAIVQDDLGGHVTGSVRPSSIEAAFGLVNSERLTISIEPMEQTSCRVTLQSRRIAAPQPPGASPYVERIARILLN
jgi:hypothetical protein